MTRLIADTRWIGSHGIGRFAEEVLKRIPHVALKISTSAVSPLDALNSSAALWRHHNVSDHYFSPGYNPPIYCKQDFSFTLHDLIHLDIESESSVLKKLYYNKVILPALKKASAVFTVSNYSKKKILEWSQVKEEKVIVVGNGVDDVFFKSHIPVSLDKPYFLYVGNKKPHKNVDFMIEAFAKSYVNKDTYLAISGKLSDDLRYSAKKLGIYDNIYEIGYIDEMDLPRWYAGAQALVMPSIYEGFGLPVIEAMASSTLVLCSNSSCLPEVAGNHAFYFNPTNLSDLADAFCFSFSSDADKLRKTGPQWAKRYSWDNVAGSIKNTILR